jgi:hypothetical protein
VIFAAKKSDCLYSKKTPGADEKQCFDPDLGAKLLLLMTLREAPCSKILIPDGLRPKY